MMKVLYIITLTVFFNFAMAVEPRVGIGDLDPTLKADIKAIKATLASVQGSLITSVGLIQDQLDQFSKQMSTSMDSRLSNMEAKMVHFEDTLKKFDERSQGWSAMQLHVSAWGDQMISLDTKVDHLARSQMERLTTITGQVNSLQTSLSHNVETLGEQITNLEGRLQRSISETDPQIISSLQRIESKVASNRVRAKIPLFQGQHLHTRGMCMEMKNEMTLLSEKIDELFLLRTEPPAPAAPITTAEETDFELAFTGLESDMETQMIKLFRRLSLPFKKANRRLRDMEDIGRQLESTMNEIRTNVQIASADFDRKFSDFFNMTLEMFEHQHYQIELSEKSLASIKLCCTGTAQDLSDFKAKTESLLNKIESGALMEQMPRSQDSSRSRAQLRFDSERILSVLQDHEKLIIDGFDNCQKAKQLPFEVRTTTEDSYQSFVTQEAPEESTTTSITAALVQGQAEVVSDATKMLKTCERLMSAGFLQSKVYNIEAPEEDIDDVDDKDFKTRFCDQETSGGGWTVIQRREGYNNGTRINFTRPWNDYKSGFGNLHHEDFWLGNDFIHALTNDPETSPMTLRVELEDFEGNFVVAEYSTFRIESERSDYRIWISGYSGNATDSLSKHNGSGFSTYDNINDTAPKCCPCVNSFGGGWWFYSCFEANLNGEYFANPLDNNYYQGLIWEKWKGDYSLKSTKMMIRSASFTMPLSE